MTITNWCQSDKAIAAAIAHAREVGFDERAERAVEDAQTAKDARLAFDAERWYLSKLNPKRYGERIQTAQTDTEGNDVTVPANPNETLLGLIAAAAKRMEDEGGDLA